MALGKAQPVGISLPGHSSLLVECPLATLWSSCCTCSKSPHSVNETQIFTLCCFLKSSLGVLDKLNNGLKCIISVLSIQLEGPVALWASFRCPGPFTSFSPSNGFFSVNIVTFEPLGVPQRHQSGWIYGIMVYFPPIVGFKFVWSFSVHDRGHFGFSASGCLILGNPRCQLWMSVWAKIWVRLSFAAVVML